MTGTIEDSQIKTALCWEMRFVRGPFAMLLEHFARIAWDQEQMSV